MIQQSQDLIRDIRSIRTQANDIAKRATSAGYSEDLKMSAEALSKAITAVEDEIIQNKIETSQDAINYPRKFSNHIGRLYGILMPYWLIVVLFSFRNLKGKQNYESNS